ncbi:MAG TPA: glycosyltransferase [Dehalococcoidia bacterium]|nr:glycosyltransferase [Dehalococcoidia bacterium]
MDRGRSAHLLIVGGSIGASDPTNRRAQNDLLRVIDDLGLRSAVTITGTLSPRDVSAHLLAADVAALPYRDGASFRRGSLLATLAHGLPLVSTRGPDPLDREVLGAALRDRENCRLVPPDDPAALAGVLTDLAADPTARAHLAAGAATLAEAFRWPAIAKQTAGLYEEVLAAKDERGTPTAGSEVTPRTTDD